VGPDRVSALHPGDALYPRRCQWDASRIPVDLLEQLRISIAGEYS